MRILMMLLIASAILFYIGMVIEIQVKLKVEGVHAPSLMLLGLPVLLTFINVKILWESRKSFPYMLFVLRITLFQFNITAKIFAIYVGSALAASEMGYPTVEVKQSNKISATKADTLNAVVKRFLKGDNGLLKGIYEQAEV